MVHKLPYALALWILSIPILLFTLLPLIGTTRPSLKGIHLLTATWNTSSNSKYYIGYYGLCWSGFPNARDECISTTGKSAKTIVQKMFGDQDQDNNIVAIQLGLDLQRKVFVAFLTAAGLVWLVSLILASLVVVAKGNAGRSWRVVSVGTAGLAAILAVASSWATSQSVEAVELMNKYLNGDINGLGGGSTLVGLQWTAAILMCIYAFVVSRVVGEGEKSESYNYNLGR